VDLVPDPLLLRKSGSAESGTSGSVALDHRGGLQHAHILQKVEMVKNLIGDIAYMMMMMMTYVS
jgi:hypothetical protein